MLNYSSYATGFISGGFSETCGSIQYCSPYDDEENVNIELGFKSDLMDGRLRLNGAIFQTTTEGFQAQAILSTPGALSQTDTYINNYQETEISGAELTLYWLPPVDGLSIRLNLGFLDPTINEASVESGRVGVNGAPVASGQIIDLFESGIVPQLARIPETSFSFTRLYLLPLLV